MRIGIYVGHPAQYHFFRHTIRILKDRGHSVLILLKTKDVLESLVRHDNLDYINIQARVRKNGFIAIATASLRRTLRVYRIARTEKLELLMGTDAAIAQVARLQNKVAFTTLEDDVEVISKLAKLTYPFTTHIITPTECSVGRWSKKKIAYAGYMKLAYLHPNYFTSDDAIVKRYIKEEKYCIVRLARLTAFHDVGIKGLDVELVHQIIALAESMGYRTYISSEHELIESLSAYQLRINVADIHHVMSCASLIVSDSQSMSVEAAMLGVPSLRFSDFAGRIRVLEELEHHYGLTFGIRTSEPHALLERITELLSSPMLGDEFQCRRQKMLADKIDVTAFMVWFIENYPTSSQIIKENPDYQYNFR